MRAIRRDPGASAGAGFVTTLVLWSAIFAAVPCRAENLPEIPLTFQPPFSARYAGMGGTSIAFADDHSACLSNPATLALVRQIEFSAGFAKQSGKMDVSYYGQTERSEFGKARLSDLGFAYPFPTYRGSFVVGFAHGRLSSLDSEYFRSGTGGPVTREEEGILETGGLGAYAGSLAFQATRSIWLGASATILTGSSFLSRTFYYQASGATLDTLSTLDYDIKGVTGSFGALVDVAKGARLGVSVQLPVGLDLDGNAHEELIQGNSVFVDNYGFTDKVTLPFRLGGGLAIARSHFVFAADATYTDWTAVEFGGPLVTRKDRRSAYRETMDLKVGAEYLLSTPTPIRVRAGYAYLPLPYRLLLTQRVPRSGRIESIYEDANITHDRQYWTVGAGVLLAESLTLDVAYMDGGFTRSGKQTEAAVYQEKQKDRRVLASLSLRLPFDRD